MHAIGLRYVWKSIFFHFVFAVLTKQFFSFVICLLRFSHLFVSFFFFIFFYFLAFIRCSQWKCTQPNRIIGSKLVCVFFPHFNLPKVLFWWLTRWSLNRLQRIIFNFLVNFFLFAKAWRKPKKNGIQARTLTMPTVRTIFLPIWYIQQVFSAYFKQYQISICWNVIRKLNIEQLLVVYSNYWP